MALNADLLHFCYACQFQRGNVASTVGLKEMEAADKKETK